MRDFLTDRWAPVTAALATVGYAVAVVGFGLVFRPLHNDEGVTLAVASQPSVRDVLDTAIHERHGPPLHYLAVHASLAVRDDMLGLRAPSALFGILAVALAYGFGLLLLGLAPLRRGWRAQRRNVVVLSIAVVAGLVALVLLFRVYSQLRPKYGVGQGGSVVDLTSSDFWHRLGDAWTGSSQPVVWIALASAAAAGLAMLWRDDRRAAFILAVWIVQPVALLSVLTATSDDFAPERHLSFLIPAYAAALAVFLVEVGRRAGRYGVPIAIASAVLLVAPGVTALSRDIGTFTPDLRNASLYLGARFRDSDVLLSTGGVPEPAVDARLYGAYMVLEARDQDPLSRWHDVGKDTGCTLVQRLEGQVAAPENAWVVLRSPDPETLAVRLESTGYDDVAVFGPFVVARHPLRTHTTAAALK